jgi:hypothetical protein
VNFTQRNRRLFQHNLPTTDITDLSDANNNGRQLWDLNHADPADFAKAVPGEEAIGWL